MGILRVGAGRAATVTLLLATSAGCDINNTPATAPSASSPPTAPAAVASVPATASTTSKAPVASRPPSSGPGFYTFRYGGVAGTVQVPTPRLDPRLERYGDYRRLARAPTITYLIAQLDNQSSDTVTLSKVVVVSVQGRQIEATPISDYIDRWATTVLRRGSTDDYLAGLRLSSASNIVLHPGARASVVLGADESITTVKRVFAYPGNALDAVEAHRVR